jgi:hypothetical protein
LVNVDQLQDDHSQEIYEATLNTISAEKMKKTLTCVPKATTGINLQQNEQQQVTNDDCSEIVLD